MKTEIIKVDINNPDLDKLNHSAEVLRKGGLVAFPTETVYGLGANALDEAAVAGIFKAKGRPSDNPLIVHIADINELSKLASKIPSYIKIITDAFWPGPLTLVMPKSDIIPHIITAGLDTVAIRMPSHPIAIELIKRAGIPIAAPSANSSGRPSPTCAQHVIDDLYGKVDIIIDGGIVNVGLESTVLDTTSTPPAILRPGGITLEQLKHELGSVIIDPALKSGGSINSTPKSPGMKYRHYAPKAQVIIVEGQINKVIEEINRIAAESYKKGIKPGIIATEETIHRYNIGEVACMGSRNKPETIAQNLFQTLRHFDDKDVQIILSEAIDNNGIGFAVMNRLKKAAGYNVIRV